MLLAHHIAMGGHEGDMIPEMGKVADVLDLGGDNYAIRFARLSYAFMKEVLSRGPIIEVSYAERERYRLSHSIERDKITNRHIAQRYSRVSPPFKHFWMEFDWQDPIHEGLGEGTKIGAAVVAYDDHDEAESVVGRLQTYESRKDVVRQDIRATRWFFRATFFIWWGSKPERKAESLVTTCWTVNGEGGIHGDPNIYVMGKAPDISGSMGRDEFNHLSYILTHTILEALLILNCKNVNLESHPVKPRIERIGNKNVAKSEYGWKHHTLVVHPTSSKGEPVDLGGTKELPLHMVRGHFVTYTKERPLFGRVVGTFYRTPHFRGDASKGVVTKDYRIKA